MKPTTNAIIHPKIVCNCFRLTEEKKIISKRSWMNEFICCRAHGNCDDNGDDDDSDDGEWWWRQWRQRQNSTLMKQQRQLNKRTHFNIRSSFLQQNLIISVSVSRVRMQWLQYMYTFIPSTTSFYSFCANCLITIYTYHDGSIVSNWRKGAKVNRHTVQAYPQFILYNIAVLPMTMLGDCGWCYFCCCCCWFNTMHHIKFEVLTRDSRKRLWREGE